MKILLLILALFTSLITFSQDSCVIKIFPNDCRNCYIGMSKIKSTGEDIKKTIVFPNLPKAVVDAYLKNVLNISDIYRYTVIVSDSVYNSLNNNLTSEVFVYNDNNIYDRILLKKFYGFNEPDTFSIIIPDSIPISNEVTIINNNSYFFITDSKFGNCIFVNKHGNNKISLIRAQDFTTIPIFNKITGDTLCYHKFSKYRDVLKSANMDKMQFRPTFGKNIMASFVLAPNILEDNNNVGLTYKYGIVVFDNPKEYSFMRIDDKTLPKGYVLYPGFFVEYNGDYYIQLVSTDQNSNDQYLLGKFLLLNNRLVFSEFPEYKIPSEYLPASKFKHLRKVFISSNPYLFLQYSRSYYNFENKKIYQLPLDSVNLQFEFPKQNLNLLKFEYNFSIIDSFVLKDTIQVLLKESDNYYVAYINRVENKLIKKMEIQNPLKNNNKIGMYFYSRDKLFYLTTDNKIIVENIEKK